MTTPPRLIQQIRQLEREAASALRSYRAEQRWMHDHGDSMSAYVERYGTPDDPDHCYGDGGIAIFHADQAALLRTKQRYEAVQAELNAARDRVVRSIR